MAQIGNPAIVNFAGIFKVPVRNHFGGIFAPLGRYQADANKMATLGGKTRILYPEAISRESFFA